MSGVGERGVPNSGAREVPGAITTLHRYELPLEPETVWSLIKGVHRFRSWWPWLRQFIARAIEPALGDPAS